MLVTLSRLTRLPYRHDYVHYELHFASRDDTRIVLLTIMSFAYDRNATK